VRPSIVLRYVGFILLVNAAFMLLSTGIAFINSMDSAFYPLLLSFFITVTVGIFPLIFIPSDSHISIREMYSIVVFSWCACCLFGILPYILWGGEFTFTNAWFESVSGYTTTGATVLQNIEGLPKSLLFFRSSTHWMGGIGVVLFAMLIAPSIRLNKMRLSKLEMSSLAQDNFKYKTQETVRIILIVYIVFTIVCFLLLWLAGMDGFDSVNHAFSTVATGGFSTKNMGIAEYGANVWIQLIIIFFMFISGIHFGLIYSAIVKRSANIFRSPIVRYYFFAVVVGIVIITFYLYLSKTYSNFGESLLHGAFQIVSSATTTGYASANSAAWPPFVILVLLFFMLQGASAGSTVGGMKIDRFVIFFKSIKAQVRKQQHPNAIVPIKVGSTSIDDDMAYSVALFMLFYLLIIFAGTLLLAVMGIDAMSSFSISLASLSNVGQGFGFFGSLDNYKLLPIVGKLLLTVLMIIGRLEIYGLILIFFVRSWK
jgi:trk system potassium uptake protein TrkH